MSGPTNTGDQKTLHQQIIDTLLADLVRPSVSTRAISAIAASTGLPRERP